MRILTSVIAFGDNSITQNWPLRYRGDVPYLIFISDVDKIFIIKLHPERIGTLQTAQQDFYSYQGTVSPDDHQMKIESLDYFD